MGIEETIKNSNSKMRETLCQGSMFLCIATRAENSFHITYNLKIYMNTFDRHF